MSKKKSKQTKNDAERTKEDIRERVSDTEDLHDSARDEERLKSDEAILDLPDVKDIPGQEFIHVPRIGEMADTTIASDDEEGVGIFNDEDELMEETKAGMPGEELKESSDKDHARDEDARRNNSMGDRSSKNDT